MMLPVCGIVVLVVNTVLLEMHRRKLGAGFV
jgi:hypothetical protein